MQRRKKINNQSTTATNKAIGKRKTIQKKRKRKKVIRKIVFAFKLIALAVMALLLLVLLAVAILLTVKYGKMAAIAIYKSIQAWHNFLTYLRVPPEVYTRILYWTEITGIIIVGIIFLRILLVITLNLRKRHKKVKNITRKKERNIPKKSSLYPTTTYKPANIIDLGKKEDVNIPNVGEEKISKNPPLSNELTTSIKDNTTEDNVIILGPTGREIAEISWGEEEISYPQEKENKKTIKSIPTEDKEDNKVIPLGSKKKKEKKTRESSRKRETQKTPYSEVSSSPITLISEIEPDYLNKVKPEAERNAEVILELLHNFGIKGEIHEIQIGPRVSRYEITIPKGTRVDKIRKLSSDIATALGVRDVRIETTVPGKPMAVAIEVPNSITGTVHIGTIVRSPAFKNIKTPTPLVLGLDVTGKPIVEDLRKQPHLLIAGATGSGKSVCINTILTGMLLKTSPKNLRLMLVDPKRVELTPYSSLPHLLFPILTEANEAVAGLEWMIREMNRRYRILKEHGVRSIEGYNTKVEENEQLPYIVVVIDELADLMMVASSETEQKIARLAQLARAAGIHLILATQRPSTDVITGLIKANIPARIAFAVSSQIDSRVILDTTGAEKLLGMGDMLFVSPKYRHPIRIQGAYTPDEDINAVVDYWARRFPQEFEELNLMELTSSEKTPNGKSGNTYDPLLREAWKLIVEHNRPSASFLQRKLRVGFNRASRILEELEELGVVSPPEGPQGKRKILRTDYDSDIG